MGAGVIDRKLLFTVGAQEEFKSGSESGTKGVGSVLAGGIRIHRASSNDATLAIPARHGKRKVRVGRRIIAAFSSRGRVQPAASLKLGRMKLGISAGHFSPWTAGSLLPL
jgi:hypothetical protein